MLPTDARHLVAPAGRSRRGLGGWIALWVAGETVAAAAFAAAAASADELAALVALGFVEVVGGGGGDGDGDGGARLRPLVRVLPWRDLTVASPPGEAFDVSALNLAASLPPAVPSLWDVGCGAGLLTLVAARGGARVLASDVDATLVEWARLNAALNQVDADFAVGDLLAPGDRLFDVVVFNAPLSRAPLAVAGEEAPRYSASPEGDALALRFVAGVRARDRVLLHAQLTPALDAALDARAAHAAVTSVVFAHAPDGTPHALTEIRVAAAPERRRVQVPLSAACPHLSREIFDALSAPRALTDDATPLPAPWLELRTRQRFAGGRRLLGVSFGGVAVDDEELALLDRLRGETLGALALGPATRDRLGLMIERGHVILR